MDRLTKRLDDGQAVMDCGACGVSWHKKHEKDMPYCTALYCRNRLKDRLAAYEDTGLEPQEIVKMGMAWEDSKRYSGRLELKLKAYQGLGSIGHLRELAQAEKEGKLAVLPCKVGDTVYRIVDRGYRKDNCETDCYSCDILCPYEGREYERVIEIVPWKMTSVAAIASAMESLGKTVFLTHAEAEAALKKKEG